MSCVRLRDLQPIDEPEETGATFEENARLKALYYAERIAALTTVAEDSGLVIDALDGEPGRSLGAVPRTGRVVSGAVRRDLPPAGRAARTNRAARFVCALAVADGGQVIYEATRNRRRRDARDAQRQRRLRLRPDLLLPALSARPSPKSRRRELAVAHRGKAFRALAGWLRPRLPASS